MKFYAALFVLSLIILGSPVFTPLVNAQSSTTGPIIVVHVTDQNGVWYTGAQVQIWQQSGPLLYTGSIQNGFYASGNLTEDSNYTVIASTSTARENQTVYVGTQNLYLNFTLTRPPRPLLSIAGARIIPNVVAPGSNFAANLTVESSSSSPAYSTTVSFNASSPSGISISGSGSLFSVGYIGGDSSVSFNASFSVAATASTGDYQVPYTLSYSDISGVQYSSIGYITVPVTGIPSRPQIVISNISFDPSIIAPGTTFSVHLVLNNSGSQTAYGTSINLQLSNSKVNLVGSSGQISVGTLQPSQLATVNYEMYSNTGVQSGPVPVSMSVSYNDKLGTFYNSTDQFVIPLTSTPNLQVGQFSLNIAPLTPGISAILTMELDNVGGDSAYNVAVTLSGSRFLTGNSSNYIGSILPGGNSKASFYLSVANNTAPGSYSISVNVAYKDITGQNYSTASNFSLTVEPYSPPAVTITNVLVDPPVLTPGTSGSITIFVKNSGTTAASNVVVNINGGDGIVSSSSFGLGTIAPGAQVTQVVGLNVVSGLKAGSYQLSFNSTYSDPTGKAYQSSVPLQLTIYAAASLLSTTTIIAIVGIVAVALVGLGLLRRSKKI